MAYTAFKIILCVNDTPFPGILGYGLTNRVPPELVIYEGLLTSYVYMTPPQLSMYLLRGCSIVQANSHRLSVMGEHLKITSFVTNSVRVLDDDKNYRTLWNNLLTLIP